MHCARAVQVFDWRQADDMFQVSNLLLMRQMMPVVGSIEKPA